MANISTPGSCLTPHNTVAGSVSPAKSHGAEFFAVATGVQIPYVGRDETGVNATTIRTHLYSDDFSTKLPPSSLASTAPHLGILQNAGKLLPKNEPLENLADVLSQYHSVPDKSDKVISKSYLKKVSSGLTFDVNVLQDRAPHTLRYDEDELTSRVFRTGNLLHVKAKAFKGLTGRHDPRGVVRRHLPCHLKGPRKLRPLKTSKTLPCGGNDLKATVTHTAQPAQMAPVESSLLKDSTQQHMWDEFVLTCLSKSTAQWIINEQSSGADKDRLSSFLEERLKAIERKETPTPVDASKTVEEEKSTNKTSAEAELVENNKPSQQAIEINYLPSFTFPPAVGGKKFETDNIFQQELLGGATPVPIKRSSNPNHIVLDTNDRLKFEKQLQENYPQGSKIWYSADMLSGKRHTRSYKKPKKLVKGLQRWKELPVVVQDDSYIPVMKQSNVDVKLLTDAYKQKKKMREDSNVVKIVEEWRSKWFLERRWQKSGTDELVKAMGDINDHVRLAAVSACSKAAELRQIKKEEHHLGILLEKSKEERPALESSLEPELIGAIQKLLFDSNSQVRIAAAITLYSLNKPEQRAESILLWAMDCGGPPEKWAATQCLALSGVITDKIIVELVNQLHADNAVRTEKAGSLLAGLSQHSDVVQSLIAELLNSNSWKDRITACRVIPKLKRGANKDMAHKLSYLMWNDWNKHVRSAAAQALGKTGNGKLVHDVLRERILTGNERMKVDALKKLSSLGVMTARLQPALQDCFKSEYVSVRIEATMAAGVLKITDKAVIGWLLNLASDDNSWKVKAHAIKALGLIGVVDDKLIDVLLWAIRYEKVSAVRAEACNAVAVLGLRDARLLSVLQDRLVVESEELVKREAIMALESLGVEPTGDVDMVEAIRQEVKRLCHRDTIVAHILQEDKSAQQASDYKRLFTTDIQQRPSSRAASHVIKPGSRLVSRATSDSSRGWDPILAGYHAREILSRAPTPGELVMRRSYLPVDLNSASSENSDVANIEDWDALSEQSESNEEPGSGQEVKDLKVGEDPGKEVESENPKNGNERTGSGLNDTEDRRSDSSSKTNSSKAQETVDPSLHLSSKPQGNWNENSEGYLETESSREDPELVALADETSDCNDICPVPSDIEQTIVNEGNLLELESQ